MAFTDDSITATSGLSITDGAGGPVFADFLPAAGKAYVTGKLGLGVINPQNKLDVEGAMAVGAGYSGTNVAPANGLLVEGVVGVGTTAPAAKLDVAGTLRVSQNAHFVARVGIGTTTPQNPLDVEGALAVGAAYSGSVVAPPNGLIVEGNVGIGTTAPAAKLDVAGEMRVGGGLTVTGPLFAARSDLYFTDTAHNHTGAGNTAGHAAIENAVNYDALMILGRAGTDRGRKVRLWDYLSVEGDMAILSKHAFRGNDTWLRLNQDNAFPSGVHTPGNFAPGSLNVGGVNGWGNPGAGNMWIAGQINKLDIADNFTAVVRAADFLLGFSGRRGSPGRALVDYKDASNVSTLRINYGGDWTGGCRYYISMDRVSSRKYKDNVAVLSSEVAHAIVERLQPVTFNLKSGEPNAAYLGFIAEDVPAEVGTSDRQAVNNDHIVAALTRVVKDHQRAITEIRDRHGHP